MATITIDCTPCYKDHISCGNDTIMVLGTLTADTEYKWILSNKGANYSGIATTDANGNFTIDVADLPNGLLNPYAGEFNLQVVTADDYCIQSTWNNSAYCIPYTCISFEVVNGTDVKNTLGCPCDLI